VLVGWFLCEIRGCHGWMFRLASGVTVALGGGEMPLGRGRAFVRAELSVRGRQAPIARPPFAAQLGNGPIERLAVDELHGVIVNAPFGADCEHRHDMRMVQL